MLSLPLPASEAFVLERLKDKLRGRRERSWARIKVTDLVSPKMRGLFWMFWITGITNTDKYLRKSGTTEPEAEESYCS